MASLRLFASVREIAGQRSVPVDGASVGEIIAAANEQFGPAFAEMVTTCRVWVNGEPATFETPVEPNDEVALLPPVSGG